MSDNRSRQRVWEYVFLRKYAMQIMWADQIRLETELKLRQLELLAIIADRLSEGPAELR